MHMDPVCKANLSVEKVFKTTSFKGKTYYFCCSSCYEKFINNPKEHLGNNWWQRLLYSLAESNTKEFGSKGPSCH